LLSRAEQLPADGANAERQAAYAILARNNMVKAPDSLLIGTDDL
jgi:hypothetical protein